MSKIAKDVMKDVCQLSMQDEIEKYTKLNMNSIMYQSLSFEQVEQLAIKIYLLPLEYRNILFFRYCFNNTPSEIDNILDIENVIGKMRYIQKMLSGFMGLSNSWIDDNSIRESCKIALAKNMQYYDNIETLHKPNYSKAFRRKLKDIKVTYNPNMMLMIIAKRVAVFILVCILSFSAVIAVNADAREKFFNWIIETFPNFSIFIPLHNDNDTIELKSLKINYVPTGFQLINIHEGSSMLIYNYMSENNQKLDISLFLTSSKGQSYYDTENIVIEEFVFKESSAYTWQTDEMTYLIWYQDGIECHISANLNKNEILKVAENISK